MENNNDSSQQSSGSRNEGNFRLPTFGEIAGKYYTYGAFNMLLGANAIRCINYNKLKPTIEGLGEYLQIKASQDESIISVGSKSWEHGKVLSSYITVDRYDKNTGIPENCSNIILYSAMPEGYLGELLSLYRKNGGKRLCVVVDGMLCSSHYKKLEPDSGTLLETELKILGENHSVTEVNIGIANLSIFMIFYGEWDHPKLKEFLLKKSLSSPLAVAVYDFLDYECYSPSTNHLK
ncbi:MAG: hypothetical protein CFE62_001365 [Candidatus Aquirickettsiella gammari]|uniref:Uncharacterized protein n=1 Tax=Candidatus Aquirickettsiella gammari TaxID=2016198 RepID=A0A370CIX1_9COXI|nr:MAG: hypothetical protein CFE62_001365 [Candidatus Aquirickettsiella gammari]